MSALGDNFPDAFKKAYSIRALNPGSVIRTHSNHTKPPKEKRFIIAGVKGNSIGVVYINSENSAPPKLQSFQKSIIRENREAYLDRDSFVDCSKIYEYELEDLKRLVERNPEINLGIISTADLLDVIYLLQNSPNTDDKTLDKFGLSKK